MATGTTAEWDVAVGSGLLRVAAGVVLLRSRSTLIRWSGGDPADPALRAVFTYFGIRDLTLGVSTLSATRPGRDVGRQVIAQGVADTADGVVIAALVSRGHLPRVRGAGLVALAWGTAVADAATVWRLRRSDVGRHR